MRLFARLFTFCGLLSAVLAGHHAEVFKRAERTRVRALERHAGHKRNSAPPPYSHQNKTSPFLNSKTAKFVVDGTKIPDVDFDLGESYAGLLPISGDKNETRQLYFWFFPALAESKPEEIAIWLNGGPGCSSLAGLLQENGPFLWQPGTYKPTANPYSWTNLTNVLWVEQPVGVGFTQGVPDINNEVALAQQFVGFYEQFVKTFDIQGWDLYLTGESYAGYYIPYIADGFIKRNSSDILLKGVSINDPIIGDETIQQAATIQPFVQYWSNLLALNDTYLSSLAHLHQTCGYDAYLKKYLTFPAPQEKFPVLPDAFYSNDGKCDTLDSVIYAATEVNPCFNIYHVSDYCPFTWTVTGSAAAGYQPPGATIYFSRPEVQKAINAPIGTNWSICTDTNVFGGPTDNQSISDQSLGPAQNDVLKDVIEYTNNVIIASGNLDILLNTNGTLLALQNTTWNGFQGFKEYPGNQDFFVPYHPEYNQGALAGAGIVGTWGHERGLTFAQVQLAGHEQPQYAPGAAYRSLEFLLGRINSLSQTGDFTTQRGNFTKHRV